MENKYFLVNLNADPSLNELLVYYLKERTLVGRDEGDIQLNGVGIQPQHCLIEITENNEENQVFLTPINESRTCINGVEITTKIALKNGDRILWGTNHFSVSIALKIKT